MIIKACSSVLSSMKTSIELTRHFVSFEQKAADELINSRTVSVETFLSLETKRLNSREKNSFQWKYYHSQSSLSFKTAL